MIIQIILNTSNNNVIIKEEPAVCCTTPVVAAVVCRLLADAEAWCGNRGGLRCIDNSVGLCRHPGGSSLRSVTWAGKTSASHLYGNAFSQHRSLSETADDTGTLCPTNTLLRARVEPCDILNVHVTYILRCIHMLPSYQHSSTHVSTHNRELVTYSYI